MRKYAVPGLITVIAAGLLAVLAFGISSQGTTNAIDSQVSQGNYPVAPDSHLALPLLGSSKTLTIASLKGKVVLVNVFASWCEPCQTEAPVLRRAEAMLKAHNGTVVGVSYQDTASNDMQFIRKYHLSFPVLHDASGEFAKAFGVTGVPENFLINRNGRIEALRRYPLTSKWVNHTLAKALKASA